MGIKYLDGPPPKYERYSINSASITWHQKPWFEHPNYYKRKKQLESRNRRRAGYLAFKDRLKFDKDSYLDVRYFPEDEDVDQETTDSEDFEDGREN